MGALVRHITGGAEAQTFQPMNINFGLFPPLDDARAGRRGRKRPLQGLHRPRQGRLRRLAGADARPRLSRLSGRLQHHVERRLRPRAAPCANPPERITSASLASPACAPSAAPASCASEVGTQIIVEAE